MACAADGPTSWRVVYKGPERECFADELLSGTEYCLRVKAKNEAGWGLPCTPLCFQTIPNVPEKPFSPHAVERRDRTLRIHWLAPQHNGGRPIAQYRVQMCPANQLTAIDDTEPFVDVHEGAHNAVTLSDLIPGIVYAIRVCAANEIGTSDWSDIGYESTPPGPPFPPRKLQVVQAARSLHLCWENPDSDGGASVTRYMVAIALKDQEFKEVYNDTAQQCTVIDLEPHTKYMIKMRAVNAHGQSEWSAPMMVETQANVPPVPDHLRATEITCTTVCVEWLSTAVKGSSSYCVEIRSKDEEWMEWHQGNTLRCCLEGLVSGKEYAIRVKGVNEDGMGPASEAIHVTMKSDPPSMPSLPCITQITSSMIRLKWNPPEANGSAILHYRVEVQGTDGALFETEVASSKLIFRIGDLTPQTTYQMRVAAVNANGSSPWSESVTATTQSAPPAIPQDLSIVETSPQTMTVMWKMAAETEMIAEDMTFDVEAFLSGTRKSKSLPSPSLRCSVNKATCSWTGLKPSHKYDVRVRAVSSNGICSKWSEYLTIRLPEEPTPEVQPIVVHDVPAEEGEGSASRRVRRGKIIIPPRTRILPPRRRKSAMKVLRSHVPLLLTLFVLIFFLALLFISK